MRDSIKMNGEPVNPCRWHLVTDDAGCGRVPLRDTQAVLCQVHANAIGYAAGLVFSAPPTPAVRPPLATEGTVYALQNGYTIKIGWTANLSQRMRTYPPSSILLVTYPGTRTDERAIHRRFAHLLTHGREWFPVAPQITEWVDRMVAQHGQPEQPTFGGRKATPRQPRAKQLIRAKGYRG